MLTSVEPFKHCSDTTPTQDPTEDPGWCKVAMLPGTLSCCPVAHYILLWYRMGFDSD